MFLYRYLIFFTILYSFCNPIVFAKDSLMNTVTFYKNHSISLHPSNNSFVNQLYDHLKKSDNFSFTNDKFSSGAHYFLDIDHAMGCTSLVPQRHCQVILIWSLYRNDYAPVGQWEARYPLGLLKQNILANRFASYKIPASISKKATEDFFMILKSL